MTLRDLLQRIFTTEAPASGDDAHKAPATTDTAAEAVTPRDVLLEVKSMPLADGVRRAMTVLAGDATRAAALALLRWLREVAAEDDVPSQLKMELADFFMIRAEAETAMRVLRSVADGPAGEATPALMALGDIAARGGDMVGAARSYESALAIDLEYPGARERLARMKQPTRAGEAGATLLAPDGRAALGRFELVRELGRGSAGAVFQARDKQMERSVALKLYHPQARADRGERLRGEARIAAAVASPFVVRVYDLFEDVGGVAMEYASGHSLRQRLGHGEVEARAARGWLFDLARALARTHSQGWVHRDVKPGNVLLRHDGRAVLTDFGLARRAGTPSPALEGTKGYMAPEAIAGSAAEARMDVYAFGALAAEMLGRGDAVLGDLIEATLEDDPARRPADGEGLRRAMLRMQGT